MLIPWILIFVFAVCLLMLALLLNSIQKGMLSSFESQRVINNIFEKIIARFEDHYLEYEQYQAITGCELLDFKNKIKLLEKNRDTMWHIIHNLRKGKTHG